MSETVGFRALGLSESDIDQFLVTNNFEIPSYLDLVNEETPYEKYSQQVAAQDGEDNVFSQDVPPSAIDEVVTPGKF
jgi:hypothetical protein